MRLPQWLHGAVTADGGEVRPCSAALVFVARFFEGGRLGRSPFRKSQEGLVVRFQIVVALVLCSRQVPGVGRMRGGPSNGLEDCSSEFRHRRGRPERPGGTGVSPHDPVFGPLHHDRLAFRGGRARAARQDRAFVGDEQRRGCDRTRAGGRRARVRARLYGAPRIERECGRRTSARPPIQAVYRKARFLAAEKRPDRHRSPSRSPRLMDPQCETEASVAIVPSPRSRTRRCTRRPREKRGGYRLGSGIPRKRAAF